MTPLRRRQPLRGPSTGSGSASARSTLTPAQEAAWSEALALWGVRLRPPVLVADAHQGSFAWFSFPPQVHVDLAEARRDGVEDQLASIFAHEIGHHVLAPSTRVAGLTITQQMARAIAVGSVEPRPDLPALARRLGNLWSDLLINVRVARRQGQVHPDVEPGMVTVWRRLAASGPAPSTLWWLVLRAYELLWSLPDGTLASDRPRTPVPAAGPDGRPSTPTDPALDAELLAETVRTFAVDPVGGALRFGMLVAPYLDAPVPVQACAGEADAAPPTAAELAEVLRDPRLQEEPVHPALAGRRGAAPAGDGRAEGSSGQGYGLAQTLELWSSADPDAVMRAWYEAAARRWVRPLREPAPTRPAPPDLPGALEVWDVDEDPTLIDWPATLVGGPRVVPGVTTRRRTTLPDEPEPRWTGVELDLYVDCSGSMRHPSHESPAVLAGAIVIGSVLRAGGRVQVTSFSGPGQVAGTAGPTRRAEDAMAALLTFFGGGTTFPLDLLAQRHLGVERSVPGRPSPRRHLLVLSDDGLASLFGAGQPAYAHVAAEVARRLDTATLMVEDPGHRIDEEARAAGYDVSYVDTMEDAPAACARLAAVITGGRAVRAEVAHG